MSDLTTTAAADHAQALADLDAGRPLQALRAWRQLLQTDRPAVQAHLDAASLSLQADAIAPLRLKAISLATALLGNEPGEPEVQQLGALLRDWGALALPEVPSRALQHFERAWGCGSDRQLDQQLAGLHARLGYGQGAHWLSPPPEALEPWPLLPCPAQACSPCQAQPTPPDPPLQLHRFRDGRIWLQRQGNPWRHSHGLAVVDEHGALQHALSRHYPWPWPACPHAGVFQQVSSHQLTAAARDLPPPLQVEGPVLAVAELSGEMFFHWQLELLPRLGRVLAFAMEHWPDLKIWHNGGCAPYVQQGLARLGVAPEQLLPACDHLQAQQLLVPSFASAFGRPSAANLAWLERFWALTPPRRTQAGPGSSLLWLARRAAVRRPVLAEGDWLRCLRIPVLQQEAIETQLQQVAVASTLVAPHGAALANLLAAAPGSRVIELVNPAYQPSYFNDLMQRRRLQHQRFEAAPTPLPLQEWLYEGPLAFPIDLHPARSPAAEVLTSLTS